MNAPGRFHEPVLLQEVLQLIEPGRGGLFLDGTVGGGGHARALLDASAAVELVGLDVDPQALSEAARVLEGFGSRVRLLRGSYGDAAVAAGLERGSLTGILLDLGVSAHQLETLERGFTFDHGAPLDMRFGGGSQEGPTAAELLGEAPESRLAEIFREYGEEPGARRLAREIAKRRGRVPFRTSDDLVAALRAALGRRPTPRDKARAFQALRIAVNEEIRVLEEGLPRLRELLRPGAILVAIAYHSLEDRVVKRAFREWSRACVCPPDFPVCKCRGEPLGETLTASAVRPTEDEVRRNPRARSARLRAWRKV